MSIATNHSGPSLADRIDAHEAFMGMTTKVHRIQVKSMETAWKDYLVRRHDCHDSHANVAIGIGISSASLASA